MPQLRVYLDLRACTGFQGIVLLPEALGSAGVLCKPARDNQPQQNLPREALLFNHALIRVNALCADV